jgi:hypothetical protein
MFAVPSGGATSTQRMPDVMIHSQTEAELVQLEAQASFLIANEDHDEVERDVARLSKRRGRRSIPKGN